MKLREEKEEEGRGKGLDWIREGREMEMDIKETEKMYEM